MVTNLTPSSPESIYAHSAREQEESEVTVSAKETALRSGLGQDSSLWTGNCCRIFKASLHPSLHARGRILQTVRLPPEVEQHSTVQSVQHAQWLHCVFYREKQERTDTVGGNKMGPVSESLILYSLSAFFCLNLYENQFSSSPCSRLLPLSL